MGIKYMVLKWVGKKIVKGIEYKINLKKIDKYVNKPNELDRQMKQVQKNQNKILKNQELHDKDIARLKKDSHPRADWICMDCGCKATKVEKPTRKRKRKLKKKKGE